MEGNKFIRQVTKRQYVSLKNIHMYNIYSVSFEIDLIGYPSSLSLSKDCLGLYSTNITIKLVLF